MTAGAAGRERMMVYHVTRRACGIADEVCVIDADSAEQALDLVDGIAETRNWPLTIGEDGSAWRASPNDPDALVTADPMDDSVAG